MLVMKAENRAFNSDRRRLLRVGGAGLVGAALGVSSPTVVCAQSLPRQGPAIPKWPEPGEVRQIWMRRAQTGDVAVARYYDGNRIDMDQYRSCCTVLRDVRAGVVAHIDVELLDLVFAMQKWLVEWGIDKPLIVHSGYRSSATNSSTEGAALNSKHLEGRAIDFNIAGIPPEYLGRLAKILRVGGVGFYPGRGITHIDTGPVRYWTHG